MEIKKFEAEHAYKIIEQNKELNMNDIHFDLEAMIRTWRDGGPSYSTIEDGEPVICGGVVLGIWDQGEAWTLIGPRFYTHVKSSFRAVKTVLDNIQTDYKLVRIQAHADIYDFRAHNFLDHLDFQWEGWPRKAGPSHEDLFLFSRIRGG